VASRGLRSAEARALTWPRFACRRFSSSNASM